MLTALPSFALLAAACADNDALSSPAGDGGASNGTGGKSGASGSSGASGESGTAGEAGRGGSSAEAGAGGNGAAEDSVAPTVLSISPSDGAIDVADQSVIRVTFSEAMDSTTLTSESFRVTQDGAAVPGEITYFERTATFTPDSPLLLNSAYSVEVSVAATDLAGNGLAEAYASTFTISAAAALGPAPIKLGLAGNFAILAKSAISNVPTSKITGNLGLSPAAASYVTGFSPTKAGTYWTSPQVLGGIFAADNDAPTPSNLTTAIANMQTAYTDAAGRPTPDFSSLGAGALGGLELIPGLYNWASSVTIPADVTLTGGANDVWIFQVKGDLELSAAKAMKLNGGAQANNVFWQVAGAVDFGTNSHAEGIVLCKTAITLGTGASINGRLLAQTAVSIASSTVVEPTP